MTTLDTLHATANDIFSHALKTCDVAQSFDRHLHFEGKTLVRHPSPLLKPVSIPFDCYKKIFVVALGKGALTMLDTLLERLPTKIPMRGVCSAPVLPKKRNWRIISGNVVVVTQVNKETIVANTQAGAQGRVPYITCAPFVFRAVWRCNIGVTWQLVVRVV